MTLKTPGLEGRIICFDIVGGNNFLNVHQKKKHEIAYDVLAFMSKNFSKNSKCGGQAGKQIGERL